MVANPMQPAELHQAMSAQQRQPMTPPNLDLPQAAARERLEPQGMVRVHQRVPAPTLVRSHWTHLHLPETGTADGSKSSVMARLIDHRGEKSQPYRAQWTVQSLPASVQ